MPEVAVPAALPLARVNRVELAHTGRWAIGSGTWNASRDDFVAAVAALDCPAVRRPVVKLGHSKGEEPLWAGNPTGAPAVGYVDNLGTSNSGHTLVGDFVGMPGWLGDIAASAYPDRSVEGTYDFRCQIGHTHPFVITAVALLGVTRPGVGTLQSLQDVGRLYGVEAQAGSGTTVVAEFDPGQPRWPDGAPSGLGGQWRGGGPREAGYAQPGRGLPDSIVSTTLKTKAGPDVEIRADRDGLHLGFNTSRTGSLDRRSADRLADLLRRGPGGNEDEDGPSSRVTNSVASYAHGDRSLVSFVQVTQDGRNFELELLNNETTIKLTSAEAARLADLVDRYGVARRVETDSGTVDLWLDGNNIGVRAPGDSGGHVELSLEPADWDKISRAVDIVWEGFDEAGEVTDPDRDVTALRVKTGRGELLVSRQGEGDNPTLRLAPADGGWSIVWPGDHRHPFFDATGWLEDAAEGLDIFPFSSTADRRLRGVTVEAAAVVAHQPGGHNQQSHGNRYGPGGRLIRRGGRLVRKSRRQTVRALDDVLDDLGDDEVANRAGMTGGPLVDLVQGIRDGVDGGQFSPDQAFQLLSSLVFRPDVASNPRLSIALAAAIGQLRGVQAAVDPEMPQVAAADGDDNQLKHYWTRDPRGLGRWATKPHPWTSLYRQLRKHVGSERAKRIASEWFHLVFGYWPGDKRHRDKVAAAGVTEPDWPEEEITLPNPNPTIIHAAAKVSVDDVRTAFYRQAPNDRTWIREFNTEPRELIVADDGSGGVARVGYDIADDGSITFSSPRKVRVAYVEDDEDEKVAASRMVYASAAESRPSIVMDQPPPPGFEPAEPSSPTEPGEVQAAEVSGRPWSDFTEADYSPEQWRRACLLDRGETAGDASTKGRYGLPVREPGGALNRNGLYAAAGGHGVGAVKGISDELRRATARKLVALYRQNGDEPPPSVLELAGQSMSASADPQPETPAAEPGNPTTKEDYMPLSTEVYQRLGLAEDADETAVSAAVMAALDKADTAPDPQQVAAAAAENETLTQKVTLLSEQVASLSKEIADANAAKVAEVKASVIDEALTKGRIDPADRDKWAQRYDKAPDAVADVLASIADGTAVPVNVKGKVGDPWDVAASELAAEPDWLFSNPTPALAGTSNEEK